MLAVLMMMMMMNEMMNEIQSDRHCEQMASCEGEKIGNVDLK